MEKDEETRDNEMYKGAEAEEGREGNASREEREQRREGEEERGKSRRVQGMCVCVCVWHSQDKR